MLRGRGDRISAYVGGRTPEEQAFWSAFRYFLGHPRADRVHWAGLMQYVTRLIFEDQELRSEPGQRNVEEQSTLSVELDQLRRQVTALERLVRSRVIVAGEPASQDATAENWLAESAAKVAESDW